MAGHLTVATKLYAILFVSFSLFFSCCYHEFNQARKVAGSAKYKLKVKQYEIVLSVKVRVFSLKRLNK